MAIVLFEAERCINWVFSAPAAVDSEKKTKVYRAVSGLTTEQILCQDEDGDTSVYLLTLLSVNFALHVAEIV